MKKLFVTAGSVAMLLVLTSQAPFGKSQAIMSNDSGTDISNETVLTDAQTNKDDRTIDLDSGF